MPNLFVRYFIILFLSFAFATLFYSRMYRSAIPQEQMLSMEYVMKNKDYNDMLFMGASKVVRQINPFIIDSVLNVKSYNLGIDQIGMIENTMLLKKYLITHPTPKYIVLTIDVSRFMFNTNSTGPYNIDEYFPYLADTLVYNALSKYNYRYRYPFSKVLSFVYPIQKLMAMSDKTKKEFFLCNTKQGTFFQKSFENRGYYPVVQTWNQATDRELRQQVNTEHLVEATPEGYHLLEEFCQIAQKKHIVVLFIYSTQYYKVRKPTNFNEVINRVNTIAEKYNICTLNYDGIPLTKDKNNFFDIWHFNKRAADKYSLILANDLKKNLFQ